MRERIGNCYIENNVAVDFCDELDEELVIPDGVVAIKERAFSEYYGLMSVKFPNTLKTIGGAAFNRCSSLRRVCLPESVISLDKYFPFIGTFSECKQLIEADLSQTKIKSLDDGTFLGCKKLQKVKLPASLVKIGRYTFQNCTNLTALELNEGLKIIECDFMDNKHISILNIPNSVIHIEDLSRCEHIKTIVLTKEQHEAFCEYLPPKCKFLFKE